MFRRNGAFYTEDTATGKPISLRTKDHRAARLVKLVAICGAFDVDNSQPANTVMLPDED